MAELIRLGGEDEGAREEIVSATIAAFRQDPDVLSPCWLALTVGELDAAAVSVLLLGIGASEGDALDETIVPALTRRASDVYDEIEAAFVEADQCEDDLVRHALYDVV